MTPELASWGWPARDECWRLRYLGHPLVGTLARRLIWLADETPCCWADDALRTLDDTPVSPADDAVVRSGIRSVAPSTR